LEEDLGLASLKKDRRKTTHALRHYADLGGALGGDTGSGIMPLEGRYKKQVANTEKLELHHSKRGKQSERANGLN